MQLTVLTKQDVELVRQWRNQNLSIWRTPYLLGESMQADWYDKDVCNRDSKNRWWAVKEDETHIDIFKRGELIGMVGLCNISLENRNAEFTIIINPSLTRKGYGTQALKLLLDKGFFEINLENIYSEAYTCNPNIEFWYKTFKRFEIDYVFLRARKFYNGEYWPSVYFNFNRDEYKKIRGKI